MNIEYSSVAEKDLRDAYEKNKKERLEVTNLYINAAVLALAY
jgi:hypothetical protein